MRSNVSLKTELILKGFMQKASDGRIFTVTFIKKDGEVRRMNARLGVRKGVNGRGMSWNPLQRGMLPVYEIGKEQFRIINFNTILHIKMAGKEEFLFQPQLLKQTAA